MDSDIMDDSVFDDVENDSDGFTPELVCGTVAFPKHLSLGLLTANFHSLTMISSMGKQN
jgi:hypothetical protein